MDKIEPDNLKSGEDLENKIEDLKQTRCKCGSKMKIQKTNLGLAVDLICLRPSCETAYHIPLMDRDQLPAPGSGHLFEPAINYIPGKEYRCKECFTYIPEDQALRTFNEIGKSLCRKCESD